MLASFSSVAGELWKKITQLKDSCGVLGSQVEEMQRNHSLFIFLPLFLLGIGNKLEGWPRLLYPQPQIPAHLGGSPYIPNPAVRYNLSVSSTVGLPQGLQPVEVETLVLTLTCPEL